ncbi:hypothetical protein E2C01_003041 [Portunus trituberculatus]|uniref:Uncharacterized protein n=1 Tax=Portunus trituberculatus TaxID=210409 RepID=A0A5B7CPY4_PORTR|nr:hypothetical protein [Portunus trituberculatus]
MTQGSRGGAIPTSLGSWGTAAAARGPTSPAMPRIRVYDQRAGHLVPTGGVAKEGRRGELICCSLTQLARDLSGGSPMSAPSLCLFLCLSCEGSADSLTARSTSIVQNTFTTINASLSVSVTHLEVDRVRIIKAAPNLIIMAVEVRLKEVWVMHHHTVISRFLKSLTDL